MKALLKMFAAALAVSTVVAAPAFAGSDNEDLTAAKSMCHAEVSKQTGIPTDQLRYGSFKLKPKVMTLKVVLKTEAGPKAATCAFTRKTQTVAITLPEGVTPVATAAATPAAAPVAQ